MISMEFLCHTDKPNCCPGTQLLLYSALAAKQADSLHAKGRKFEKSAKKKNEESG